MTDVTLPQGWSWAKISDISYKVEQRTLNDNEHFFYVDIGSIDRGLKKIKEPKQLLGKDAPSRARKVINTGDILVSLTRPNLNAVAIVPPEYDNQIASTGFEVIKTNYIDSRYVFGLTRSKQFIDTISGTVQGALYPAAKSSDVQSYNFPLPPLAEQKVIADKLEQLLGKVENIKAHLEHTLKTLKRFRQSALIAAVSGKLTRNKDKYKVVHVADNWAHDIEGKAQWKQFKFSEVVNITGGSQPPKSDFKSEYLDGYVRLIQIRDYKNDRHKVYIPLKKARRFVTKDDVMIGRYGPPIFQILRGLEGAYNVALMKAEPNPELIDNEYLYWYLQNYKLFNYIDAGSDRTAGQTGVNKKYLESYPILVPPLVEQREIVRGIEQLLAYIEGSELQVRAAMEKVNSLTQSILAKAFRGELTEQWRSENIELISGDNSAKALLARIKAELNTQPLIQKNKAVNRRSKTMSKIMSVLEALEQKGLPLTGQELLASAGYAKDSDTVALERFFLDLRESINQGSVIKSERDGDGQDWFALKER